MLDKPIFPYLTFQVATPASSFSSLPELYTIYSMSVASDFHLSTFRSTADILNLDRLFRSLEIRMTKEPKYLDHELNLT